MDSHVKCAGNKIIILLGEEAEASLNDFTNFWSAKFHEICTQDVDLQRGESFWNKIYKIFPQEVDYSKKPTSSRTTSNFI